MKIRIAVAAFFLHASVYAQAGLGTLQGTIVDASDAVVPTATLKLVQESTNIERETTTSGAGLFVFPSLVPSAYKLTINAPGFKEKVIEGIRINTFQVLAMGNVMLETGGGPATTVTVTAEAELLKRDSAVRYEAVQSKQVTDMPLQGRNWTTLLKIIPGTSPINTNAINGREASYDGYADFRINGKNPNQTQVNLDGGSIVDHGNDAKTTVAPSLESIQEVSVLTNNFQAEYGNRSGAVINVVTKSGTNAYHGTVWNYLRNEALNANSWENNYFGRPRQRYRYNYFGANLGGPIKKDKLFFFYNFENLKQDTPTVTRAVRVPTLLERRGDFSETINADGTRPNIFFPGSQSSGNPQPIPGNRIPANLLNPLGQAIANLYPEPNLLNDRTNNYLLQFARLNPRVTNVAKVDWNIDEKTRAYVRYSFDNGTSQDIVGWITAGDVPFALHKFHRPDRAMAVNLTRTFAPTLVNENLFSWSFDYPNSGIEDSLAPDKIDRNKVGLGSLPTFFKTNNSILPQVSGTIFPAFHFNRFPVYARANEWQYASTWTWTHGAHIIKFGGQYIRNTKDEIDGSIDKGAFDFGVNTSSDFDTGYSPANLVTGALNSFRQVSNVMRKKSLYQDMHGFVQDTWKIRPNLTLDFGMRFYHIPSEYNTDPDTTLDAVFVPSRWDPAKAPRFYVPDPSNPNRIIDPANPNSPLPANVSAALRYSLVPGSGDPLNGVVKLGDPAVGNAGIRNPKYLLFAPRGGLAWSVTPKTIVRLGFGWTYNRPAIGQAVNTFENGFADVVDIRQTSLAALTAANSLQRITPRSFGVMDETSNAVPTVYDYSFSVQREIPFGAVFEAAYIGNLQRHQPLGFNINSVLPGTSWKPEFQDPRLAGFNFNGAVSASNPGPLPGSRAMDAVVMRPYRGFENLNIVANVANARYDSMQLSVNKRYSRGFTAQGTYTWGKLNTQIHSPGPYYFNWKDFAGEYPADNDRRHVVGINYSYEVPDISKTLNFHNGVTRRIFGGWAIAHLMNFYSGRNISPGFGIQFAGNTNNLSGDLLNNIFLGTPNLGPRLQFSGDPNAAAHSLSEFYNAGAFQLPGTFPNYTGLGARNFLFTPSTFSNDMNISKQFQIVEGKSLELRASLFNPFNQVRRQDVNSTITYKARGANLSDGFTVFNTPDTLVSNLLSRQPNAMALDQFNQYRAGFGHQNLTSVQPMRIIEIGLRFRF